MTEKHNILIFILGVAVAFAGVFIVNGISQTDQGESFSGSRFFYPEGSTVATSGRMTISESEQIIATSTTFRTSASICNTHASANVYLGFDSDAVPLTGTYGYELGAGECYTIDGNTGLYQGAVRATSSLTDAPLTILEFKL